MMEVKICGMTREQDVRTAADAGADFVGLILAPSKRQITIARAAELAQVAAPAQPVLLFMNQPLDEVATAVEQTQIEWVQLHGDESPQYIRALRDRFPAVRLIKAWSVTDLGDADRMGQFLTGLAQESAAVERILIDVPKGGTHPGYPCLAGVAQAATAAGAIVWAAGGLTPDNLAAAVPAGIYHGVDVASGVESAPGEKDAAAVRAFIRHARAIPAKNSPAAS